MSSQASSSSPGLSKSDSVEEDLDLDMDIYYVQQLQEVGELMNDSMDPEHKDEGKYTSRGSVSSRTSSCLPHSLSGLATLLCRRGPFLPLGNLVKKTSSWATSWGP